MNVSGIYTSDSGLEQAAWEGVKERILRGPIRARGVILTGARMREATARALADLLLRQGAEQNELLFQIQADEHRTNSCASDA